MSYKDINESEDEFDWVKDVKLSLGFDDLKPGDLVRLKDYDNNNWEVIDIYMSDPSMTGKPSEKRIKFRSPFRNSYLELWKSPLNSENYFELIGRNPDRVYFNINESEDEFDWVENPAQYIKVGRRFNVKTSAEPITVQIVRIVEKPNFNRNTIYFSPINLVGTKYPGVPMNVQRLLTHINNGNWTPIKKINESEDDFEWAQETIKNSFLEFNGKEIMIDIQGLDTEELKRLYDIVEPYISKGNDFISHEGEEIVWMGNYKCFKNITTAAPAGWVKGGVGKFKSISLHCGIEDNDYLPLKGVVCCLDGTYDDETSYSKENIIPINAREIIGGTINESLMKESEEEFEWAEDIIANTTEEIDISNDFDLWKNKLVEGSVVKITGKWEDMDFQDDIATIVNSPDTAGSHLLKFDRVIYGFGMPDEGYHTHCGENETQNIKCECQRRRANQDEVGKCWWTGLRHMEKIIYLPFEGKQITESEDDLELFWAEDLLDFDNPINITGKLDIMEELPVGSILQVKGYQDEMEFDMDEVKLIDKGQIRSNYYLFKLKHEKINGDGERLHCGNTSNHRKICDCRPVTDEDEVSYGETEVGKCWWINLEDQDKVIYYPNRTDLTENKIKKPLLTEGRYDAITRKVVRDIMKLVTTSSFGDHDLPYDINNEEYEYQQENLGFSVELQIVKTEKVEDFFIDAATSDNDDDETVMLVKVFLNPTFDKQNLEKLFYKLQEVVRHEVEHFTQHGPFRIEDRPTYKGDTTNLKTVYGHHKNVVEVPALVHGFYRRAKLEKKPLDEIMIEDLDSEIEKGLLTKNQAENLLTMWLTYAKKNLPSAIYKNN